MDTSVRQFGFKKQVSCTHALFTVNKVVNYFIERDSTVNMCCLDISKAFDSINHNLLFVKLIDRGVPLCFVRVLCNWYSKLVSRVQWGGILSPEFKINCGVRQGGVLSPVLFNIYIDNVLKKLDNLGCFVNGVCYGSLLYADDLVILTSSWTELHKMVDICYTELSNIGLNLNENKSFILNFGKHWAENMVGLSTARGIIPKTMMGTYLGLDFISGKKLSVNLHRPKSKFYASFNTMYSKLGNLNDPSVSLYLTSTIAAVLNLWVATPSGVE